MESLYIDESGTMTVTYCTQYPYFIIGIVRAKDPDKLRTVYKRFVSSNMKELEASNKMKNGDMFKDGKFVELKGNSMTNELKHKFVKYFCQNDYFEIFYIVADNRKVKEHIYKNTARAFNYLLKIALSYFIHKHLISGENGIDLQLDERNERTDTKHFLETYLNTELYSSEIIQQECRVSYFDSSQNKIIQIADVFSNLYFSYLMTDGYTDDIEMMKKDGYLKFEFTFPLEYS